jgi:hypothetical protein
MHPVYFIDFATMSKRLGELWATVPTNEKYVSTSHSYSRTSIQKFHTHKSINLINTNITGLVLYTHLYLSDYCFPLCTVVKASSSTTHNCISIHYVWGSGGTAEHILDLSTR